MSYYTIRKSALLCSSSPIYINPIISVNKESKFPADTFSLAYAEMFLTLAILFRPNGPHLELFETDETDVLHVRDYIQPLPKRGSKGIRVLVR